MTNIIIEPGKTFQHIKEKDDWWIPFILVVLIGWIFTAVTAPAIARLTAQKMAEMGIDRELPKFMGIFAYIGVPFGTVFLWVVVSLILWFLGGAFGADWNYTKALDLYAYSSVVQAVRSVLSIIVLLVRGVPNIMTFRDLNVATGLNLFFSPENPRLYALFSGIEVFTIWQFILIAYGLSEFTGISKKKSAVVSIISFLIVLGFNIAFAGKGTM
jgi:hypothetical protein